MVELCEICGCAAPIAEECDGWYVCVDCYADVTGEAEGAED